MRGTFREETRPSKIGGPLHPMLPSRGRRRTGWLMRRAGPRCNAQIEGGTMLNVRTARRAVLLLAGIVVATAVCVMLRGTPAAAAPAAPPASGKAGARAKVIAEIRDFEDRFNKAYESNDLNAYFDFYTSDMTYFDQQGRLDLPDYRKLWEKEVAGGGGMEEVKIADMTIQVGPSLDSAVAAYRIFTRQRHPGGAPAESWNQESDVLFKRGGAWRVAHVHYSDAPKAN
ncbi:MAG: hypothetical protein DMF51_03275 [Acidobacteria bacterium]|nr:MAG: hypothetical protein DMF51_03275 [Acidobacteriota bacterium]